jgi:hypothetical protein
MFSDEDDDDFNCIGSVRNASTTTIVELVTFALEWEWMIGFSSVRFGLGTLLTCLALAFALDLSFSLGTTHAIVSFRTVVDTVVSAEIRRVLRCRDGKVLDS